MFFWEEELNDVLAGLKKTRERITNVRELAVTGRISKQTHDTLAPQLQRDLVEVDKRRKDLLSRLTSRHRELTEQSRLLERLDSDLEMKLAYSLVSEDHYAKISTALKYGLEETTRELESVALAMRQLSEETAGTTTRVLDKAIRRLEESGET